MNNLTIFNHLGNNIRVMTDEQGEPWFVLNDICDALEIGNPRNVAGRLDEDDVHQADVIDKVGRNQKTRPSDGGYSFSAYPFYSLPGHLD